MACRSEGGVEILTGLVSRGKRKEGVAEASARAASSALLQVL